MKMEEKKEGKRENKIEEMKCNKEDLRIWR